LSECKNPLVLPGQKTGQYCNIGFVAILCCCCMYIYCIITVEAIWVSYSIKDKAHQEADSAQVTRTAQKRDIPADIEMSANELTLPLTHSAALSLSYAQNQPTQAHQQIPSM
jgi:methionine-rich copper-binding protein CopC